MAEATTPEVTNEDLKNVIGGIDDRVVTLGKDVKKDMGLVQIQIGELKKSVDEANGRQRSDHDKVITLETNQANCPVFKGGWTLTNPKVLIGTIVAIMGLFQGVQLLFG